MASTTFIGRNAETRVASELERNGHKIIAQNWRTRTCEIDLISIYRKVVFFTEVKFRSNMNSGSGLEYITRSKLRQMLYAARLWCMQENYEGDYILQAAEVTDGEEGSMIITEICV